MYTILLAFAQKPERVSFFSLYFALSSIYHHTQLKTHHHSHLLPDPLLSEFPKHFPSDRYRPRIIVKLIKI